jgi:hypothetical protein
MGDHRPCLDPYPGSFEPLRREMPAETLIPTKGMHVMTHREEVDDLTTCADCGAEISRSTERGFAIGDSAVLCFACAERRGGSYDAEEDRWTRTPSLSGLDVVEESDR